jgi:hypothetical protein
VEGVTIIWEEEEEEVAAAIIPLVPQRPVVVLR